MEELLGIIWALLWVFVVGAVIIFTIWWFDCR